jgi:hypothetical protein
MHGIGLNGGDFFGAMKLHLGCGQRYLDGYVNIDYPPSEHTVQRGSVADHYADLLDLSYPESSIEEVRLHHVFEHFARHTACALIASWQSWLKDGGVIRIEVPDLVLTGLAAINPLASSRRRGVAERHLFGSHEAHWASHKEGYTARRLRQLVEAFGFLLDRVDRNRWRGTYNFELVARKGRKMDREMCAQAARTYLATFLVDDTPAELKLLDTWMELYSQQVERTSARPA